MSIVRHKGSIIGTGTRCTVVFRELPGDTGHCLIIEADSLPEVYRDAVARVTSNEGQATNDLCDILNRNVMPTGENMLGALHKYGLLKKRKVQDIMMHPDGNMQIRLDELNKQLAELSHISTTKQSSTLQDKYNPYEESSAIINESDSINIAQRLIKEAAEYESEATRKRERAYTLRPELKSNVPIEEVVTSVDDIMKLISDNNVLDEVYRQVSAIKRKK
jgi:hypothetical protein